MKAILVIDMPRECNDGCPLYNEEYDSCGYYKTPARYENCPLKPMPKIKNDDTEEKGYHIGMFNYGWNECLKEIEK